jgi:N,N'-diacetyllegionaminate synthase
MSNFFKSKKNSVYYIAEIGGNHEGSAQYAKKLTDLALKSGADAIKYQIYTGDTLVSSLISPDRNSHFKKFEIDSCEYINFATLCKNNNKDFMASVWGSESLKWIDPFISIHKVGSGDLTCYPLIKLLVATKKPIILSTGLSTMSEVSDTVKYIEKLDRHYISDKKLALLQCTSSYPTPNEDANLYAISELRKEFNLPVGYSDHTEGSDAIEIAISLGATIIEKHFTDTRLDKNFRDHKVSLSLDEVNIFLEKAKKIKTILGRSEKFLTNSELEAGHHISFRRSIYALSDIDIGSLLTEKNLTYLRPDIGISAMNYEKLLGKTAIKDIKKGCLISEKDFQ